MYITLDEIKQHLRIDADYQEEDDYLLSLVEVAESSVSNHINQSLDHVSDKAQLPAPIKQAILLMAGNLYNNREPIVIGTTTNKLPLSYEYLLSHYIKYSSI